MFLKSTQFFQALLFCIIAGQAFFYLIGGSAGLKSVSASTFIEQRKAIDVIMSSSLKVIYLLALAISVMMLVLLREQINSPLFVWSALACLLLVGDIAIATTNEIPLNKLMQTWSSARYPANWTEVRAMWFLYMNWRQWCNIPALCCMLLGMFS